MSFKDKYIKSEPKSPLSPVTIRYISDKSLSTPYSVKDNKDLLNLTLLVDALSKDIGKYTELFFNNPKTRVKELKMIESNLNILYVASCDLLEYTIVYKQNRLEIITKMRKILPVYITVIEGIKSQIELIKNIRKL